MHMADCSAAQNGGSSPLGTGLPLSAEGRFGTGAGRNRRSRLSFGDKSGRASWRGVAMSESSSQPHGVMEGGGAYNRHAKPQAQGIGSALSLFEQVVRDTAIDDGN